MAALELKRLRKHEYSAPALFAASGQRRSKKSQASLADAEPIEPRPDPPAEVRQSLIQIVGRFTTCDVLSVNDL